MGKQVCWWYARQYDKRHKYGGKISMEPDAADASQSVFQDASARLQRLTPRQYELLGLLLQGDAPEEIAQRGNLSVRTVRNYLQQLYDAFAGDNTDAGVDDDQRGDDGDIIR